MAMAYVKIFVDCLDVIEPLDDGERGRLFTALLQYAKTGEAPALQGNERFLFPMLRKQHDRDTAAYRTLCEANRIKGAKGGRSRAQAAASQSSQDKEEDKEEDKDKEKDKDYSSCGAGRPAQRKASARRRFPAARQDAPEAVRRDMEQMDKFLRHLRQEAREQAGNGGPPTGQD